MAIKVPTSSQPAKQARFLTGSTMRHVTVMTFTGAIGLMAMFLVDLADLYFISLLGDTNLTAAIGYAGNVGFANLSLALGLGIAAAALVARNLGAGTVEDAKRLASTALAISIVIGLISTIIIAIFSRPLLHMLGADGPALEHARSYLLILSLGFPLLAASISVSFSLRAIGDARRAMYPTLAMAITNAILDPVLIFGFDFGMNGAAMATVCANVASLTIGLYALYGQHRFLQRITLFDCRADLKPLFAIAGPAIMTQLATPFFIAYLTYSSAKYGNDAVAAVTIVNRLIPVAFGMVFSLSGAVGPIIGQNYGANNFTRVRQALRDAMLFIVFYTLIMTTLLWLLSGWLPTRFKASEETAMLVTFYCNYLAISWTFTGAQFVAQATFNNLGKPLWSTFYNWGRATLGTIPFILSGAYYGGIKGVLVGSALGSSIFGLLAAITAWWLVRNLERRAGEN